MATGQAGEFRIHIQRRLQDCGGGGGAGHSNLIPQQSVDGNYQILKISLSKKVGEQAS